MSHTDTDVRQLLQELHLGLAKKLVEILKDPEATPSQLEVIRKFLSDNRIEATMQANPHLKELVDALPFRPEFKDEVA
jgi:hypothetical protein